MGERRLPAENEDSPRLPDDDLRVDFGSEASPGATTPADITLAYEQRLLASVEAQAAGARLARFLFVGSGISNPTN